MANGHSLGAGIKKRPCWCLDTGFTHFPRCCQCFSTCRQVEFRCLSPNMLISSLTRSSKSVLAQVWRKLSHIMFSLIKITYYSFRWEELWCSLSTNSSQDDCERQEVYLDSEGTNSGASVGLHHCWGREEYAEKPLFPASWAFLFHQHSTGQHSTCPPQLQLIFSKWASLEA